MRFPRIPGVVASLSLLLLAGCLYKFSGGGFPPDIKTVAVLPFDNLTAEPALTQQVTQAVRDAVEGRLGLRPSGEQTADAVVRGSISRYDPDLPVAYSGNNQNNQVDVTRRQVQITVSVEIVAQKDGRTLWQRGGMLLDGDYQTGNEADGRKKAVDKLVTNIVDGAQSQW
ncbi:MAG TPA: LPS assembly lipoprotein LptE [Gemmatimonadales bacterium]|nr:LPS assembly lipoprotein LptE [Gemmatimonadales bacterium]